MFKDKTIMSFWHNKDGSDKLPPIVCMSIKSFIGNCKEYHLYSYQKFTNVPDGCICLDANQVIPFSEFFIHKSGSIAMFSDYFRIELLLRFHDAVWSDTDNIFLQDGIYKNEILAIVQDGRIQNSILYFGENETGNKIRSLLRKFLENPLRITKYDSPALIKDKINGIKTRLKFKYQDINYKSQLNWTTSGSELYTCIFSYLGIKDLAYDYYRYFNPYHFTKQRALYNNDISTINMLKFKDVGILILSTDLLRREPDIIEKYNNNSFIATLFKKFGVKI